MVDTSTAYNLLLNGSFWPAINSYYTIVFVGWFYAILWAVILMILLIKTKSATLCFTIGSLMYVILYATGLITYGTPSMVFMFVTILGFLSAAVYTWIAK